MEEMLFTRLKNARIGLNLSQEFVAKQMKLQRTAIVKIESGDRNVSAEELAMFSNIYGISIDELVNGRDVQLPEMIFARSFSELDENDQREILNLMEFKKQMKEKRKG